jgi:hypothetical protein
MLAIDYIPRFTGQFECRLQIRDFRLGARQPALKWKTRAPVAAAAE